MKQKIQGFIVTSTRNPPTSGVKVIVCVCVCVCVCDLAC